VIQAVQDKVFAKLMVREKTSSGILIPDSAQEPQAFCKVVSVGEDVYGIDEGDIIVCHLNGGMDVLFDNEVFKVLKQGEIYGILKDEKILQTLKELQINSSSDSSDKVVQLK